MTGRVLITGAAGFIGRGLQPVLERAGWVVCASSRRAPAGPGWVRVGELGPDTDWRAALAGCDAVVHLAARVHVLRESESDAVSAYRIANVAGTERLARQAARAGVRRLVYLSSIKVNGEATTPGRPFRGHDSPRPQDAYGESKWAAEQALARVGRETGLEWVVLRPPLVYGPGVGANFLRLMEWVRRGWPLPLGGVDNRRSLVGVANLADAVARCLTEPRAAGRVYLPADGEDVSTAELIRRLATRMGRPARLMPWPPAWLEGMGRLLGRGSEVSRLTGSLCVDPGPLRDELGWQPVQSLDAGLADTVAWFLARERQT